MQQQIVTLQASQQQHSSSSSGPHGFAEHHGARPPRFQKITDYDFVTKLFPSSSFS
jgi:hypothetical protein